MANVNLAWALPNLRDSGKPLDLATVQLVEVALSGDKGETFSVTDTFPPAVLSTVFTDMEPGEWQFRGVVVDTSGRRGKPKLAVVVVPDNSPPGELLTFEATLV